MPIMKELGLEAVAELVGMNIDELKKELETKTIEQVFKEHGFTKEKLVEKFREMGFSDTQILDFFVKIH